MKNINEITDERVKVGQGTLYSLSSRFEKDGIIFIVLIEEKKKNYSFTKKENIILNNELRRLDKMFKDGVGIFGGY